MSPAVGTGPLHAFICADCDAPWSVAPEERAASVPLCSPCLDARCREEFAARVAARNGALPPLSARVRPQPCDPLVEGGQGRSGAEVESAADVLGEFLLCVAVGVGAPLLAWWLL